MNHNQKLEDQSERQLSFAGTYADISGSRYRRKDEWTLAHLGKKQVLKVW